MHAALLLLPLIAAAEPSEAAQSAVGYGQELLINEEYDMAIEHFQKAVKLAPKWAAPHYAMATAMAKKYAADRCSVDRSAILKRLAKSVKMDPKLKKRLLKDRDLASVQGTLRLQVLAGRSIDDAGQLFEVINAIKWSGPEGDGLQGPMSGIEFKGEIYEAWTLEPADNGGMEKKKTAGYYKTEKGGVVILEPLNKKKIKGRLTKDGKLSFKGFGTFTDAAPGCGA